MTCCAERKDFCVKQGATFNPIIRWGAKTLVSRPITAITLGTPAAITAPAHGVPDGWPVAVVGAQGMRQINAEQYPPRASDWLPASVSSPDTLTLNDVSSANYTAYTGGGALVYAQPIPLAGVAMLMALWPDESRSGTPLATLTNGAGITVDSLAMTIIPLLQTAALTWTTAYYDLQATDISGNVTALFTGTLTIEP